MDMDMFVVVKDLFNFEVVMEYLKFVIVMQQLVDQVKWIVYGLVCKSLVVLVGMYQDGKIEMGLYMLINFEYMIIVVMDDLEFWVDYQVEMSECFNVWFVVS